jgi:hypothetical protein
MGLKELAKAELAESEDYRFHYWYQNFPVRNDICWTIYSEKLKSESFRFSHDTILSLKMDGEEIPFARIKEIKRLFLPKRYSVKVEILPCMIPQALEALSLYMQTDAFINNDAFSKGEVMPKINQIKAVQKELYNVLESSLLEGKPEEPYEKRMLKKRPAFVYRTEEAL